MEAAGRFLPSSLKTEEGKRVVHHVDLDGKGRESQETEEGHLKAFGLLEKRNRVYPFGAGPKVPELPEESTDQARDEQEIDPSRIPLLQIS